VISLGLRFVEDLTQSEIADEIGVSQMQISRILRGALTKLTELVGGDPLRQTLTLSPAQRVASRRP
jgi:transcriptional regulator with XRE-family HTH domain